MRKKKEYLFILVSGLREKKLGNTKSNGKFVIFAQKWVIGRILILILKIKKISDIFKITGR